MNTVSANVGRMIRARRLALGVSLNTLAKACKVSANAIHKIEAAKSTLSVPRLVQIAKALKCEPGHLLGKGIKPQFMDDYPAAAEALFMVPQIEAIPRLSDAQRKVLGDLITAMDTTA